MKKILVLAYCVSPYRGSEYAVAWNYIINMSKTNELTILYGCSDDHIGEIRTMKIYLQNHSIPNVTFVPVGTNRFIELLNWPNKKGYIPYSFYLAYNVWHKCVYKTAKKLCENNKFDLIHYVGPIGYREPGYLWRLGLPYIWGPIGGGNNAPRPLLYNMTFIGKFKFLFRNYANTIQLYCNPRLRKALYNTDVLLTATTENREKFLKIYNKDSIYIPENGLTEIYGLNKRKFDNIKQIRLIIVGRLCEGKAVRLLLEVLTKVKCKNSLHLDIVGDGPLRENLEQYAIEQGINEIISWHGQLPREEAIRLFDKAHLNVLTSVSEGNPTVIWEAMSYGVPTISFDHCGMHDVITESSGIKVPIGRKYSDCVTAFADAIDDLLEHPDKLKTLAEGTIEHAKQYLWSNRANFLNKIYDELLEKQQQIH